MNVIVRDRYDRVIYFNKEEDIKTIQDKYPDYKVELTEENYVCKWGKWWLG